MTTTAISYSTAIPPHRIEVGASWVVSEKLPFTLSWYTILFGAADRNDKGERAYASYFEVAYPFTVKTVDMKAGVGMVPWNAATTYNCGDRDFYVQNVFLNAGKTWDIKGCRRHENRNFHQSDLESCSRRR